MLHASLFGPFAAAVVASDAGAWFDAAPWLGQPPLFWREALRRLCHSLGTGLIRESAVGELLRRLSRNAQRPHEGWIALKRENRTYMAGTRVVRPELLLCSPCTFLDAHATSRRPSLQETSFRRRHTSSRLFRCSSAHPPCLVLGRYCANASSSRFKTPPPALRSACGT